MMKKTVIALALICCMACQEDNNLLDDLTVRGGYILFEEVPSTSYNLLDLASFGLNATVEDPNNNATSYSLTVEYEGVEVPDFLTVTSFPGDVSISLQMLLDAFNLNEDELSTSSLFNFTATVTTPTGVYKGSTPSFNSVTNVQEGGNSASNLSNGGGARTAMSFVVTFFTPPPKKIRGTSFEEPFADPDPGADYIRPEGVDNDAEGQLLNNEEQRHVMHIANGSGVDDELGFTAEFISNGGGGFSNEEIGVTQKTEDVVEYIDGIQGYQVEDVDGILRLTFDKVTIPAGISSSGVRLQAFFRSTTWEDDDRINVYAIIEKAGGGIETLELFNEDGIALNDMLGRWILIDSGFLTDNTAYTLVIETTLESTNEEAYYDEVLIYQPE